MAENSKIQWTDHTFNPWWGCEKVSPGCNNCYAETLAKRTGFVQWGTGKDRRRTSAANWRGPVKWNKEAEKAGVRARVFCASMADWLDDAVPVDWLADLLALIAATPHLDWQLLTKRPENWRKRLEAVVEHVAAGLTDEEADLRPPSWALGVQDWLGGTPPANVWAGTTVEDQRRAHERILHLLRIPALVRYLSMEPLLEAVSLRWLSAWPLNAPTTAQSPTGMTDHLDGLRRLDWVIVGGESGHDARPFDLAWARSIRDQCAEAGVACFVKQFGASAWSNLRADHLGRIADGSIGSAEVKAEPMRLWLKDGHGGDWDEWPADLRVRQFPEVPDAPR